MPTSSVAAYGLLVLSAVTRMFGPTVLPLPYPSTIVIAGILWLLSFGLNVAVYAPILLGPRVDGKRLNVDRAQAHWSPIRI